MSAPISMNLVKQLVESFESCDEARMDELAFAWLEQAAREYGGPEGQEALGMLDEIRELLS